jgi:hypothetical protein
MVTTNKYEREVSVKLRNQTWVFAVVTLMLISGLLIGCGGRYSSLKVGWVGSNTPGKYAYQYKRFSGIERKTFRADAGEAFALDYEVDVDEGTLALRLVSPDGETRWEQVFEEDIDESIMVTLEQDGRYRIEIEGNDTKGSFDLEWEIG